ncbi:DUF4430 domain-containing protein [Lactobacillus delbrueckii]|uniref:DUF4430 domain-containing protein n=1 Tax=Lactobacillus delbrueckii TaxID=1584 RepID=UPI00005105A8|nr:DUF4430 domain-containing protein [Lactobacillus delbrueckii]ABJ57766.1 hypothetical protein LBUL_0080 [Lactobacillus delbrueckii subsp. bulgaricus ATCC BAA-365]KIY24884.1 hypothetical protein SB57_03470 [Lactobacillus delbrueckii subsp. bulgaricus]MBT8840439.1 hypothetical protein [Lactobacillus delbrueckii subsp. bulgaricus]MCD5461023.1 DUF4430 domain-containing protein [Lactobacillus delbrueckii subsp. bulgaricus]NVH28648.1 DUF4430 domain-containing protein [Lactobacillus delbrueckii sub
MKKKILAVVVASAAFMGLFASQPVQKQNVQAAKNTKTAKKTTKKAKAKQISVTYTLKDTTKAKNKQTLAKKTFKVKKGTSVFTVLKKAWKVNYTKSSYGVFITKIKGLGNEKKKLYWTYTVDGKMAKVAADKQKLTKNKSKVVFTLKQYVQAAKNTKTAKKTTKKAKAKQISVTYTLKDTTKAKNKQTLAKKTFKVKKGTSVFTVLKKAWKVNYTKSSKYGVFITKIKGLGDEKKKLYWTYTVDGKMAEVAADKQKLTKNKSKVVFTLKQY